MCDIMNEEMYNLHANICKTFTSPVRLQILNHLREGEKSVNELAKATGLNQPNISQHLAVLRLKRLVITRKDGNITYYAIANKKIFKAFDIVQDVILEQLNKGSEIAERYKKS